MKYALVNGTRLEAQAGVSGFCPFCGAPLIARCGEIRVAHWAHKRGGLCDPWWENETDWHRNWKNQFPVEWQEVVHEADSGEKHIADVKTDRGWAIEFQHSHLKPEERRSRDNFYTKLIWVIDGLRRKTDRVQFSKLLKRSRSVGGVKWIRRIASAESRLFSEWCESPSNVFLDFGEPDAVWWLLRKRLGIPAYVGRFSRNEFVQIHLRPETESISEFEKFVGELDSLISAYESNLVKRQSQRSHTQTFRLTPNRLGSYRRRRRF